eukprot:gene13551-14909_t
MNQVIMTPFSLYQSTLPILFVDSSFLGLCHLPPKQIIQYLCCLEPQLPSLSQMLNNLLSQIGDDITCTSSSAAQPSNPISFYQKNYIRRKDSNISSEDLAKINGFILATIFYAFHRVPPNVYRSEEEKIQEERDRYVTEKQTFLQQYADLLQTAVFSEIELHFLVNYEYVIRWIYQNIFSQGKQVNQEYVMIAGMALEGSHRIWARGGGSRGDRRVREEIYRRVSGKRKHKRTSKQLFSRDDEVISSDYSTTQRCYSQDGESLSESEKQQLKEASLPLIPPPFEEPTIKVESDHSERLSLSRIHRKQQRDWLDDETSDVVSRSSSNLLRTKKMKLMTSKNALEAQENEEFS